MPSRLWIEHIQRKAGDGILKQMELGKAVHERPAEHEALLEEVRSKRLKEEGVAEKLRTHIEQCDATAALETVTATGMLRPRQDIYLVPFNETSRMLPEMHHPSFVLRLHASCINTS